MGIRKLVSGEVRTGMQKGLSCYSSRDVAFSPVNSIQGTKRIVSREIQVNAMANQKAIRQIRALQENKIIAPK